MQTAWKVQNKTCCWFALRSLLDRKNNSHFYTFHSCLWRATSLLFDSCWHSATGYLTYYGYNSELFCKISNWNKNKVQALYGKAPPRGPTFYPFISTIFRGKVPVSYNNNNISFICVTIGSYTIAKALGTDHLKTYGGAGEVQKKIFAQGKIKWKKIHARQLILKNIHAMA